VTPRTARRAAWRALALLALLLQACSVSASATAPAPARATRPAARKPLASKPAAADSLGRARPASRLAPRTLDDIHIEGEIPVPQVLFITARDQRRFMEFQHHRYTRTSLELGRGTAMPSRIVVPEPGPVVGKENPR
jgi:hypothetical protein